MGCSEMYRAFHTKHYDLQELHHPDALESNQSMSLGIKMGKKADVWSPTWHHHSEIPGEREMSNSQWCDMECNPTASFPVQSQ